MITFEFDEKFLARFQTFVDCMKTSKPTGVPRMFVRRLTLETLKIMRNQVLTGQVLKVQTGMLRNSFGSWYGEENKNIVGLVGSGVGKSQKRVPYANIHETGGVIKPVNAKYLTIPLKGAMVSKMIDVGGYGRVRVYGSRLRGGATGARGFNNTFVRKSKAGNLLIFQKKGKTAVPIFVLKKSVTIPARKYMSVGRDISFNRIDDVFDGVYRDIAKNGEL